MLIEKYERYIEMHRRNRDEFQNDLFELGNRDLTKEEREYQATLMGDIKYASTSISIAEYAIKQLKEM